MNALGINQGKSGNLSVRTQEGFLVTPSGLGYDAMEPEDIVAMGPDRSPVQLIAGGSGVVDFLFGVVKFFLSFVHKNDPAILVY